MLRVALLPRRTLSCTYVLDCNRGTNKPTDDDDDDRWAHAARQFVSIEFSIAPGASPGETKMW